MMRILKEENMKTKRPKISMKQKIPLTFKQKYSINVEYTVDREERGIRVHKIPVPIMKNIHYCFMANIVNGFIAFCVSKYSL